MSRTKKEEGVPASQGPSAPAVMGTLPSQGEGGKTDNVARAGQSAPVNTEPTDKGGLNTSGGVGGTGLPAGVPGDFSRMAPLSETPFDEKTFEETEKETANAVNKQPKVQVFVPLEGGEKPGTILPVNINGRRYNVPKGVAVSVPQVVAEIIAESLNIYASNSATKYDLDNADTSKKAALNV